MSKIQKSAHFFINRLNSRIEATFRKESRFRSTKTRYKRENRGVTNPPSEATLGIQNRTLFTCKKKVDGNRGQHPKKKKSLFGRKSWESCTRFERISRLKSWGHPKGTIFVHTRGKSPKTIAFLVRTAPFPPFPGKTYFFPDFLALFHHAPKKRSKSGIFWSLRLKTVKIVKISLFRQKPTLKTRKTSRFCCNFAKRAPFWVGHFL